MYYTSPGVYKHISQQNNDPIVERKTCPVSGKRFAIYQSDVEYYKKVSPTFAGTVFELPPPTLCPEERQRRRMSFRHETHLYSRTCDATGKRIISAYSPDKPYKVYDFDIYWSDQRDPLSYGISYKKGKSFFEQFQELQLLVPRLSLLVDSRNKNSKYVNQANMVKDCYLIRGGHDNEACMYGYRTIYCNNTCDTSYVNTCEYCYQCIYCDSSYNCNFCHLCDSCQNSWFLYNCTSCEYCFLCTNLTNKKYCIENKQYSKEDYFKKIENFNVTSHTSLTKIYKEFLEKKNTAIHRATLTIDCTECTGHMLRRCKDCKNCFSSGDSSQCSNCLMISGMHTCMDISYGRSAELVYEGSTVGDRAYKACFCIDSRNIQDCYYCDTCIHSKHCFGCIGLNGKEYCIFNTQYTKEEYEQIVPKIIEDMRTTGERGEFFPMDIAAIAYNESAAGMYYPLEKNEILLKGMKRKEINHSFDIPDTMNALSADSLPDTIQEVDKTYLQNAIICETSHRPFRITQKELNLYHKKGIPLPRTHPNIRNQQRISHKEPRELHIRTCDSTGKEILSAHGASTFPIYSQEAYLKEIYG